VALLGAPPQAALDEVDAHRQARDVEAEPGAEALGVEAGERVLA
jgi:hypothetical protein